MSANITDQLTIYSENFAYFSLAIDESVDITSTTQFIFVSEITQEFEIIEELIGMTSLSDQTKGSEMLSGILEQYSKVNLVLLKLSGIVADCAPSMIGSKSGLVTLLKQHLGRHDNELMQFQCLIHQENLCAKSLGFEHVMKAVISTINFIKSRGLNHRQFKIFLADIEKECGDLIFVSEVSWLS